MCVCVRVCVLTPVGLFMALNREMRPVLEPEMWDHTHLLPQIITLALFLDLSSHSFLFS